MMTTPPRLPSAPEAYSRPYLDDLLRTLSIFFNRWDGADDYAFWQHVSFDQFIPDLQDIDNPDQLIEVMSRQAKQAVQNAAKIKLQLEP